MIKETDGATNTIRQRLNSFQSLTLIKNRTKNHCNKNMKFQPLIRVMKTIVILLTCFLLHAHADTYGQRLTIHKKNSNIADVLRDIRKQTGYDFFYDANIFVDAPPISLDMQQADIHQVLSQCFANQPYTYSINNNIVTIKKIFAQRVPPSTSRKTQQHNPVPFHLGSPCSACRPTCLSFPAPSHVGSFPQ